MSAGREKDQADFDLETFVDLFDTAMSSDNPAVKRALKNLILISALVDAKSNDGIRQGPLRRVVEDIKHLNQRLQTLEMEKQYRTTHTIPPTMPSPGTGQWPPGSWPQITPTSVPGTSLPPGYTWTPGTSTSISGGSNSATSYTAANSLLEKLEIKVK